MPMRMKILRKRTKSRVWVTGAQLECTQRAHTYDIHAFCYIYGISLRCSESKQHTLAHTLSVQCAQCKMCFQRDETTITRKNTHHEAMQVFMGFVLYSQNTQQKRRPTAKRTDTDFSDQFTFICLVNTIW